MGDPETLAEELGRVHTPWWGYLWRASQWAAVIVLIWAVLAGTSFFSSRSSAEPYQPALPAETEVWTLAGGATRTRRLLQSWEPEGAVWLGGYRFTVPMAYLVYNEPWTGAYGDAYGGRYKLTVVLRAWTWRFWEPLNGSQSMILDHTVTDSGGNAYARSGSPESRPGELFCSAKDSGGGAVCFEVYLNLPTGQPPRWVDIPVGRGGDRLRVDLVGEVVS